MDPISPIAWLKSYSDSAARSDRLTGREDHLELLATGLMGEAGSIVAEQKKMAREDKAYPAYRHQMTEELGDFLWYFARLVAVCDLSLFDSLPTQPTRDVEQPGIENSVDFGAAVGSLLGAIRLKNTSELRAPFFLVWEKLNLLAHHAGIPLDSAAAQNYAKTSSRWPERKEFFPLFDDKEPIPEQIPRKLTIDFIQNRLDSRVEVLLRANGINVGDRLTDNITDPDGYRFHDIFHMAYAVFVGWSPVLRALLRCKRKSNRSADENEDGARALIVEEAISAIAFSRAKNMRFFEDTTQVDYDLLKNIKEFTKGYEVEKVPLWQWEQAILEGFRVFRSLLNNGGGRISWDLNQRNLVWVPPAEHEK